MNPIVLDVETTISNKGNPYDQTNSLCYIGVKGQSSLHCLPIEYGDEPFGDRLDLVQQLVNESGFIVGFNLKFDLAWLKKYSIDLSNVRVWDCQLVHFILTGQQNPYPSLDGVAGYYKLGSKLDAVSTYWEQGIDTPDIPQEILEEYLTQDLELTWQVFEKQVEDVRKQSKAMQSLISLHNNDLLVLLEMEGNGLYFDEARCNELAKGLREELVEIDRQLFEHHRCPYFNPNSTDHLSLFLYGGRICFRDRQVVGVYKTGTRKGEVKHGWVEIPWEFPRLVKPIKGSELKKEGFYSTDEPTLRKLKGAKKVVELLLRRAELEKRVGTYYEGLVNLRQGMNWEENELHGQLNQVVARTGRLSSSKPNLQNIDGEIKEVFKTRYV